MGGENLNEWDKKFEERKTNRERQSFEQVKGWIRFRATIFYGLQNTCIR